jgi:hypothetical protein
MAQFEIATGTTAPSSKTDSHWDDDISAQSPNHHLSYSVPPPPPNRHIDTSSVVVPETAIQFVKFGESRGIRSITDRMQLLRLFNDFKGSSGADDNRDEFSRVLFEMSRNQKIIRVIGGKTIEWCDSAGYAPRHVSSARPIDRTRDTRDTRDFNRPERPPRDNYERDYVRHERPQDTRDTRPRDSNRPERPRDNYERDSNRPERPRDNEDSHRRISELMRTIESMEKTMERMQNRLDFLSRQD